MKKPWVRWVLIGLGILGVVLFFQGCYMFFEPIKIDHSVGCINPNPPKDVLGDSP